MSKSTGIAILLIFLSFWSLNPARAEDYVVMESTSPRYADGTLLTLADRVKLKAGENLLLLNSAGGLRKIAGPFDGFLKPGKKTADGMTEVLSRIVRLRKAESRSIGAMRGYWRDHLPPKEIIDIENNPVRCISGKRALAIELRLAGPPQLAQFWREGRADRVHLRWPAANVPIRWPAAVEIENGGRFFVLPSKAQAAYVFTISILPATFPSRAHEAMWLWQHGCRDNARSVVDLIISEAG